MMTRSFYALLVVAVAHLPATAGAQAVATTVWFSGTQAEISDKLALVCANHEATVTEQDDRHVLCTRPMTGVAAAYMFGVGRGASSPDLNIRFALLKDGKSIRVQASQWVENQSALGQSRRTDLNSKKQVQSLEDALIAAGGHNYPPDLPPLDQTLPH